jgi:protein-tyrosine phosphatase
MGDSITAAMPVTASPPARAPTVACSAASNAGPFRILFVCTGNACRSVIAERLAAAGLRARLGADAAPFHVASAGTGVPGGAPPHPYTAAALGRFGVGMEGFSSRGLTAADIDAADLILSAGWAHREQIVAMRPRASRRVFLLREFARLAMLAAASPTGDGPAGGGPVGRARHVVAEAAGLRGRAPYVEPGADDVADPELTRGAFNACADVIDAVLRDVLDALCGVRLAPPEHGEGLSSAIP